MASQTWSTTPGCTATSNPTQSLSSTLLATPLSRSSSSSSDLMSSSSATSIGLPVEDSLTVNSCNLPQDKSPDLPIISPILMASQFTSVDDEPGHSRLDRRLSGRPRKPTAKYQALQESKLLPLGSSNNISEDSFSPPNATMLANGSAHDFVEHQASSVKARSASRVMQPSLDLAEGLSLKAEESATEIGITTSETVEEELKRTSGRARKPTAKALQSATDLPLRERSPSPIEGVRPRKARRLTKRPSMLQHALSSDDQCSRGRAAISKWTTSTFSKRQSVPTIKDCHFQITKD
jgi:hypothetical protein